MVIGFLRREDHGGHVVTKAPYKAYDLSWWLGSLRGVAGVTEGGLLVVLWDSGEMA